MARSSRHRHWSYLVGAPTLAFALLITSLLMPETSQVPVRAATVTLTQVLSGLSRPIFVTHAGDGSGRLFVVEKGGVIKVLDGQLQSTPFLDITSRVKSDGNEEGLLGLAFHPSYASNGYFYVYYNLVGSSNLTIARYQVTANRNVANPNSEAVILSIPHPTNTNHNGGMLAFGADGYLYAGIGDGGGAGDMPNNAQNLSVLLGKLLRIDVNGGFPYAIPATNPFAKTQDARGEIWALGLRNPWRFGFDRLTHDLFLADVGQGSFEEIDRQAAGSPGGQNYQWRCMEGFHVFSSSTSCTAGTSTPPIFEYDHSAGNCSVTGGYVYRGPSAPSLAGKYLYGDFCTGLIWMLQPGGGTGWSSTLLTDTPYQISSFGEDEAGDVYVVAYGTSGAVYKFVDDTPVTSTSTTTATRTGSPIASPTSTPSNTRTNTPTNTLTPTNTPTRTPTSTPGSSQADLVIAGIAVEEGPGPFAAGQVVHVSQTVRNTGGSIPGTTNVRLSDRLPAGASVVDDDGQFDTGGAHCVVTLPDVICDYAGGLGIGQQFTATIPVRLPSRIPGRGDVTIRSEVDPQKRIAESSEGNNKGQLSIQMQ